MITQTVVDGIPTLLSPAAGPVRGGVTFRVGQADEPLARSGITHLVEHLSQHRLGLTDYHYNGATGSSVTHFFSQGSLDDIGEYLNSVCAALTNLPFERLEMEKEILRTEAAGRGHSPAEPLAVWRYGAQGYGVSGYPEWGLSALTPDDLRAWVARYFTRENAVLWFTASSAPTNLRLSLPSGSRMPLPPVTSALPKTPAWFSGGAPGVAMHTTVPRSSAAQVYTGVLERELFRALRQEGGYSYTAGAAYEPLDKDTATVLAMADAHPEKKDAALGAFIDVVAKLRWGTIDQADIDATVEKARDALRDPDVDASRLPSVAFNVLIDGPMYDVDQVLRETEAVTVADVRRIAEGAAANALLMVPDGHRADWAGYADAPTNSLAPVTGTRIPMHANPGTALVLGSDGVSVVAPDSLVTVRFAECAAVLAWPDGGRMLIGNDAIICRVEPTLYPVDAATMTWLDSAVPAHAVVRMPPRDPDAIPRPAPVNQLRGTAGTGLKAEADTGQIRAALAEAGVTPQPGTDGKVEAMTTAKPAKPVSWFRRKVTSTLLVLFLQLSGLGALVSVVGTISAIGDPESGIAVSTLVVVWALTVAGAGLCVLFFRQWLRHRRQVAG